MLGIPPYRLAAIHDMIKTGRAFSLRAIMREQGMLGMYSYAPAGVLLYYFFYGPKKQVYSKTFLAFFQEAADSAKSGRMIDPSRFEALLQQQAGIDLARLESQWREWFMTPPPMYPGTVSGNDFISEIFRFKFSVPGPEWKIVTDREMGGREACWAKYGSEDARMGVSIRDLDGSQTAREFYETEDGLMKNSAYRQWRTALYKTYEVESRQPFKVKEFDAVESILKIDKDKGLRSQRWVSIEAYGTMYEFCLDYPYGETGKPYQKEFPKILESFSPLSTNLD
jgi:hypothetical protein